MTLREIPGKLRGEVSAIFFWLLVAIIAYLAICAWFDISQFHVFAGDDLRSFSEAKKGSLAFNDLMIAFYKLRPVTALLFGAVARWTNCDFRAVASIGLMLHTINGFLFFYLLHRRIHLPLVTSFGITVIAVFNRFATYLFMQDSALTEGLVIAVFLVMLIVSLSFIEQATIRRALCLTALFTIIIYTYEQYLVLAPPLLLLGIFSFHANRKSAMILSAGVILSSLSNFWIKAFVLHTPILIGTAAAPIRFARGQICSFLWSGALNVVGVNRGPAYLSLEDFSDSPVWVRMISLAAAILSCLLVLGIIAGTVSAEGGERKSALIRLAFYGSTIAVLVLSASITFRQQYSWLYPSYLAFLAFLGSAMMATKAHKAGVQLALTCFVLLSLSREIYLSRRHSRFFAFQADQIASNLFTTLHHINGIASIDTILIRGEVPAKDFVFMANRFFKRGTQLPGGYTFSKFYALPNLEFDDKGSGAEVTDEARLVLEYDALSSSFKIPQEKQLLDVESHQMNYSVLEGTAAAFPPNPRWSTPTKTPVFLMSKNGVNCVIAVAPVDIRVRVPHPGSVLHVCFSHMYAKGDGTDLEIASLSPAGTKLLLSRVVPPLLDDDFPVWRKYEFALPADAEQVDLHVFSKTDPAGDWIAIRDFSFD
jgi:hypothetical protein